MWKLLQPHRHWSPIKRILLEGLFSDLPFNDDIEGWDKVVVTDKSEGVEHVEQADHVEDNRPAWPLILSESILQESESESILQEGFRFLKSKINSALTGGNIGSAPNSGSNVTFVSADTLFQHTQVCVRQSSTVTTNLVWVWFVGRVAFASEGMYSPWQSFAIFVPDSHVCPGRENGKTF